MELFLILGVIILILLAVVRYFRNKVKELEEVLGDALSRKQSLSTKYGQMTEQFMPFLKSYPYDKQNFRFIGSPVDGVQFEDDKIVLMEFKASDSSLTGKQRRIRELVKKGKVRFEVFRVK
jgi:predicted Holliday junction resolvase-like endonuclease